MAETSELNQSQLEQHLVQESPETANVLKELEQEKTNEVTSLPPSSLLRMGSMLSGGAREPQRTTQDFIEKHGGQITEREKRHTGRGQQPQHEEQKVQKAQTAEARERRHNFTLQEALTQEGVERSQTENLLTESLSNRLQEIQRQLEQVGSQSHTSQEQKPPSSIQEIAQQAQQAYKELQQLLKEKADDKLAKNELQRLREELDDLQEVAQQLSDADLEKAYAEEDKKPMTYNIAEFGIDESKLTPEQLETLEKIRKFAKNTSKTYRSVMRVLMNTYQQNNPNFTDRIIRQMKERGYDLPSFSIYGRDATSEFLNKQDGLSIDSLKEDSFLVNFNLPKPISRFWYRGGSGSKSVPVPQEAIEWGDFYRRSVPVIWNATDQALYDDKLYFDRLNRNGQHDPKKYYYLWEASNIETPDTKSQFDGESPQEGSGQQVEDSHSNQ